MKNRAAARPGFARFSLFPLLVFSRAQYTISQIRLRILWWWGRRCRLPHQAFGTRHRNSESGYLVATQFWAVAALQRGKPFRACEAAGSAAGRGSTAVNVPKRRVRASKLRMSSSVKTPWLKPTRPPSCRCFALGNRPMNASTAWSIPFATVSTLRDGNVRAGHPAVLPFFLFQ